MKICFWGQIGKALNGMTSGGGELQIALLAKALARGGHEVIVLDTDTSEEFYTDDGIKVCPIYGWNKGIKIIRTLTHRLPNLYYGLRDQKADAYYCRIRDSRHIIAYWAARKVGAKFFLGLASDLEIISFRMRWKYYYLSNLTNLYVFIDGIFSEIIYPWLLRKSDIIFVQHAGQKEILLKKGIKSIIFPNLIDLVKKTDFSVPDHDYFVYVGWLDKRKGFAEFYDIIVKAPQYQFKVIGPPRDKTGYNYFEKLKSFKNVSLLGELCHAETIMHIALSKALISTSPLEGFPNIFIEAWAFGVPVISLNVDPGHVIEKERLGLVAHGKMENILNAMDNISSSEEFAKRAKAYVEKVHSLNNLKIKEIGSLFSDIINN